MISFEAWVELRDSVEWMENLKMEKRCRCDDKKGDNDIIDIIIMFSH